MESIRHFVDIMTPKKDLRIASVQHLAFLLTILWSRTFCDVICAYKHGSLNVWRHLCDISAHLSTDRLSRCHSLHISAVTSGCFAIQRQLWNTQRSLSRESLAWLVIALATLPVDYCNAVLERLQLSWIVFSRPSSIPLHVSSPGQGRMIPSSLAV